MVTYTQILRIIENIDTKIELQSISLTNKIDKNYFHYLFYFQKFKMLIFCNYLMFK